MKVPESVKEGWQGGGLGAGAAARARPGRHRRWPARSKQSNEVLHPDVRLPQNGPQRAPVQFSMLGDNGLRKRTRCQTVDWNLSWAHGSRALAVLRWSWLWVPSEPR